MLMLLPYFVAAAVAFCGGFFTSNRLDSAYIHKLELEREMSRTEFEYMKRQYQAQERVARNRAERLRKTLEEQHGYEMASITRQYDDLRLWIDTHTTSDKDPVSRDCPTRITEAETTQRAVSRELAQELGSEAYRADVVSAYADSCFKFVIEENCGVRMAE